MLCQDFTFVDFWS